MIKDDATRRQIQAADPMASTWVSANAGSGKTRVLTDRVARLLLAGVDPSNILCLTYTKAAASEMQNRLFRRLGAWAMMPDDALRKELYDMGAEPDHTVPDLSVARRLFATAIEVPGGLRIQTIHSFCSSILRRFPLEAGVSPAFTEMEDRAAEMLREEVLETIAEGPQAHVIDNIARLVSDMTFPKLAAETIRFKREFLAPKTRADLAAEFGIRPDETAQSLLDDVFDPRDLQTITAVRDLCLKGSSTDQKNGAALSAITGSPFTIGDLRICENVFLTGSGAKSPFSAKIGSFPTKATQSKDPALIEDLNDLMERVQDARQRRLGVEALDRTMVLYDFARVFIPAYEERKLARGLLDFDDLIDKTRDLLTDEVVANWVLFKLDGGIDHILVDEAQDTSPAQWAVVDALSREFAAGEGARADQKRTIFVVGDKKQSIYSFQGADPEEFDRMRSYFDEALQRTDAPLISTELQYSFRSSQAILSFVDGTFTGEMAEGLEQKVTHIAFKKDMPGRVDLWPFIEKTPEVEKEHWYDPVDLIQESSAEVKLAKQIAAQIDRMIRTETIPEENGHSGTYHRRPVQPRDFLILVQRRSKLFNEIIRACKNMNLPIAGADVLTLSHQLAVQDILSLLKFLSLAEDDLALAEVLKSPLFGWTEQQLFHIAHGRKGYLWASLRDHADEFPETMAVLNDMRRQADFLRPYDLIERMLTRHGGRKKLVYQLGAEAEDAIDALLSQALAYERSSVPGLTGFLHWMETEEVKVKRQMDSAGNLIRVMTVHGSKGLEAPIVILPETQDRRNNVSDGIIKTDSGPIWKPTSGDMPETIQPFVDHIADSQTRERRRLLYVALTRAEKWLIIAGANAAEEGKQSWYDVIRSTMDGIGATDEKIDDLEFKRFSVNDWNGLEFLSIKEVEKPTPALPDFGIVEDVPERPKTIAPSDLGGAKALAGEFGAYDTEVAMIRGSIIHQLLEHLPNYAAAERYDIGQSLIDANPDAVLVDDCDVILDDVIAMIDNPELSIIFDPATLAEVEITAEIPALGGRLFGAIDRLIVDDTRVLCIDFKSNRAVPDTPEQTPDGILRQMAAYRAALAEIYPDHRIDCAILWTATATLMELPPATLGLEWASGA